MPFASGIVTWNDNTKTLAKSRAHAPTSPDRPHFPLPSQIPSQSVVSTVNLFEHLPALSVTNPTTKKIKLSKTVQDTPTHILKSLRIGSHSTGLLGLCLGPFVSHLYCSSSFSSQSCRSTGGLRRLPFATYCTREESCEAGKDSTGGAICVSPFGFAGVLS